MTSVDEVDPRAGRRGPSGGITFTLDLEDHRPSPAAPIRFPANTRRILDFLDERQVRATVFIVGRLADQQPDLIREVADRGHELGLHGWHHALVSRQSPTQFREGVRRGKAVVEDLTGQPVAGYRAPFMSVTPATVWVPDILADEGYTFASTVCDAATPDWGLPGVPTVPFRWPSGLVEFPLPRGRFAIWRPFVIGGALMRLLPWTVVDRSVRYLPENGAIFTYCHPHDLDDSERYWSIPELGPFVSVLAFQRRAGFLKQMGRLLDHGSAPPLGERISDFDLIDFDYAPIAELLRPPAG